MVRNPAPPLLDWADQQRARRNWDGFLSWGRWNDQLLGAGLLEQYLAAAEHISEFREDMRRQLCSHLASVAVSSEIADLDWIRTLSPTLAEAHRLEWTSQVSWMLGQLPPDAVEHQWQRWMGEYWRGRLDSVPVELTANEASALAGWAIYLTESIGEGVNLATARAPRPASLGEHQDPP